MLRLRAVDCGLFQKMPTSLVSQSLDRVMLFFLSALLFVCLFTYLLIYHQVSVSERARRGQSVEKYRARKDIQYSPVKSTYADTNRRRSNTTSLMMNYFFSDTYHQPDAAGHVNPYVFNNVLAPSRRVCGADAPIYLFIFIHSAPNHRKRRDVIRQTWGNAEVYSTPTMNVRRLFVMGLVGRSAFRAREAATLNDQRTLAASIQADIEAESVVHDDILQDDFIDDYRNLTYKAMAAMKWISGNCFRNASRDGGVDAIGPRYVLKTDDDAFVNVFGLLRFLRLRDSRKEPTSTDIVDTPLQSSNSSTAANSTSAESVQIVGAVGVDRRGYIMCNFKSHRRVSRSGKWGSTPAERPYPFWPPFCLGLAYVITGNLLPVLYRTSLLVPFLWLDDVYVTGFLPLRLGSRVVQHVPLNSAYVGEKVLRYRIQLIADSGKRNSEVGLGETAPRSASQRGGNRFPGLQFSHTHNLQLFYDVWKELLSARRKGSRVLADDLNDS